MLKIQLSDAMEDIVNTEKNNIILYGGRVGGKTKSTVIICVLFMLMFPYTDGVVARANYGSLRDSAYSEFQTAIEEMGELVAGQFIMRKSPLRIERINDAGTVFFQGYGGSNTSRTKGIKTRHKIKFVMFEETQELKSRASLDEAVASYRRNYGTGVKVFTLFNPPPMDAHWINVLRREKEKDDYWLVKNITYLDILPFLNDYDLRDIIKEKLTNEDYYKWFYLGQSTGGFGSIYPMFRRDKYVITPQELDLVITSGVRVLACVIGGDGAVTRDCTAFTPKLILSNGQSVDVSMFYHNPRKDAVLSYHILVQDYLSKWFDDLCTRYRLGTRDEVRHGLNGIPIFIRIDSAAPDLVAEVRYFMGDRCDVAAIKKSDIMSMVATTQSAINNDMSYIVDYGGYHDYYMDRWIKTDVPVLVEQITTLIWNEKQTGYENTIPNDVCDAYTYANLFWYGNNENMQWFNIISKSAINNADLRIRDIIKGGTL